MNGAFRSSSPESGFTLLEATLAAALLALFSVALASAVVMTMRANERSRNASIARAAAGSVIKEIMSVDDMSTIVTAYDGMGFAVGTGSVALHPLTGDADGLPGLVTATATTSALFRVNVRVDWRDVNGANTYEVATQVTDRNPR